MAGDLLGKLGEAFVLLRADGSTLNEDLSKQKKELEKELNSWEKSFKNLGKGLSTSVTPAIVAIGAAAVGAGVQLEEAFDTIRVGTGATGKNLEDLKESFKNVFSNVPSSAKDVATAIADINTRTGQTGPALEKLATQILNMSRITKTDLNANIAAGTRAFGDWSIATDKQSDALDTVFKASQATGITVTSLMENLVRYGAPLRQFNFSFEESAALMGKWEKEGVNAELVLGSLRIGLKKFADEGIPAREGLRKTIEEIQRLGPSAEATSIAMKTFGSRAGPDMAAAILEGRFAIDDLVKSLASSKETIQTAAEETEHFGEKWTKVRNKIIVALEPIGTKILSIAENAIPMLEKIAGVASSAADGFSKLSPTAQNVAIALAGIAAAAGPVIYLLGSFVGSLTSVIGVASKLAPVLLTASAAVTALGVAVAAISLYKIVEAGSLINDLRNQSKDAAKDVENSNKQAAQAIQIAWEKAGVRVKDAAEAYKVLQAYSAGLRGETIDLANATDNVKTAWENGITAGKKHRQELADNEEQHKKTAKAAADEAEKQRLGKIAKEEAAKATKEYNDKLKQLEETLSGKGVIDSSNQYVEALKRIGGASKLTADEAKQVNKVFEDTLTKLKALGQTSGLNWDKAIKGFFDTLRIEVKDGLDSMPGLQLGIPIVPTPPGPSVIAGISAEMAAEFAKTAIPITFKPMGLTERIIGSLGSPEFGNRLGSAIIGAIQGGGSVSRAIGGTIGQEVGGNIGKNLASSLTKNIGGSLGKVLGGVAGSVVPVVGTLLGSAVGGLFGKLFGGDKEKKQVEEARQELIKSAGGIEELKKKAEQAGVSLDKLLKTGKMKDFNAEVDKLNKGFSDFETRMKGIQTAISGVNTLAQGLSAQLAKSVEAQDKAFDSQRQGEEVDKLTKRVYEGTEEQRAAWERLGKFTLATFAEQVRATGDVIGALQDMQPAFDVLVDAQEKFGFAGSESTERLLTMYKTVKDNADVFTSLSGVSQIMRGLGDAIKVNGDLALAFGQELAANFKTLTDRGVDTTMALALMQPQLQQLWELQKEGKLVTDDTTQSLLDQAEAQGIVGEQMKDVNEKILDVLLAIGEALGATLPASVKKFADSVGDIQVPEIEIPYRYKQQGGGPPGETTSSGEEPPPLAEGGFANWGAGSLAVLHGPEAVIPLDRLDAMMSGSKEAFDPAALADAMIAAGIGKGDLVIAPTFQGMLANEARAFMRENLLPLMISVLQDSGELRSRMGTVTQQGA